MAKFKVMRHDMEQSDWQRGTQCGAAVKTAAKAADLRQRMRAQQAPGSSVWFTIERA